MLDPATAGLIATTELSDLREWLEKRWNATPRDTRMLQALLKHLPGGQKLTKTGRGRPVFTGDRDGGSPRHVLARGAARAGWLHAAHLAPPERISNEVSIRTRAHQSTDQQSV